MGLFSRSNSTSNLTNARDAEAKAARISRKNAAQAAATGRPVRGVDAAGWNRRAETFQAEADSYQKQLDRKRR
ncbi:hypothetical protein [Streptomyces sp. NPDC002758]